MKKVIISVDSAADLPQDFAREKGIAVMPMLVVADGKVYRDGVDMNGKRVFEYVEKTGDKTKTIIASTASPFKFNGAVLGSLVGDEAIAELDEFRLLEKLAKDYELRIPASLASLEEKEVRFEVVCDKNQMKAVINEFLAN